MVGFSYAAVGVFLSSTAQVKNTSKRKSKLLKC
jgi:hypothetical protein